LVLAAPASARASDSIVEKPSYVADVLLRIGVTTEGRFSIGLALDVLPATFGIDFSPRSALGPFRAFAGLKEGIGLPQFFCSAWGGLSAVAVYGWAPQAPGHFGVGLGAHFAHIPISQAAAPVSFPQPEQGGSARFSWFPGAGALLEGSFDVGMVWAPGAYCQSD
jgi:hypothetical protein